MEKSKTVTLGQMLAVTTRYLTCDMVGVYDILDFMLQTEHYTHQLSHAAKEAEPYLLEQHPFLAGIDLSHVTPNNVDDTISLLEKEYGKYHTVYMILPNSD